MPEIRYFDSFPTIDYDMYRDKRTREVIDILRRIRIREDYKNLVQTYSSGELTEGERPDIVATKLYGRPELHYIMMMLNGVVDPYHDWVKDDKTLENYVKNILIESYEAGYLSGLTENYIRVKYPNRSFLFTEASREHQPLASSELFVLNETLTGSPSGATGTLVKFDISLLQLTYKLTSTTNFADGDTITGGASADAIVVDGTPTYEWDGVHHYEIQQEQAGGITNRFRVDKSVTSMKLVDDLSDNAISLYNLITVTNFDYEVACNEEKRKVTYLNEDFVSQFESEFKDKIQR